MINNNTIDTTTDVSRKRNRSRSPYNYENENGGNATANNKLNQDVSNVNGYSFSNKSSPPPPPSTTTTTTSAKTKSIPTSTNNKSNNNFIQEMNKESNNQQTSTQDGISSNNNDIQSKNTFFHKRNNSNCNNKRQRQLSIEALLSVPIYFIFRHLHHQNPTTTTTTSTTNNNNNNHNHQNAQYTNPTFLSRMEASLFLQITLISHELDVLIQMSLQALDKICTVKYDFPWEEWNNNGGGGTIPSSSSSSCGAVGAASQESMEISTTPTRGVARGEGGETIHSPPVIKPGTSNSPTSTSASTSAATVTATTTTTTNNSNNNLSTSLLFKTLQPLLYLHGTTIPHAIFTHVQVEMERIIYEELPPLRGMLQQCMEQTWSMVEMLEGTAMAQAAASSGLYNGGGMGMGMGMANMGDMGAMGAMGAMTVMGSLGTATGFGGGGGGVGGGGMESLIQEKKMIAYVQMELCRRIDSLVDMIVSNANSPGLNNMRGSTRTTNTTTTTTSAFGNDNYNNVNGYNGDHDSTNESGDTEEVLDAFDQTNEVEDQEDEEPTAENVAETNQDDNSKNTTTHSVDKGRSFVSMEEYCQRLLLEVDGPTSKEEDAKNKQESPSDIVTAEMSKKDHGTYRYDEEIVAHKNESEPKSVVETEEQPVASTKEDEYMGKEDEMTVNEELDDTSSYKSETSPSRLADEGKTLRSIPRPRKAPIRSS